MRVYDPGDPNQPKSARDFAESDAKYSVILEGTVVTQHIRFGEREVSVAVNRSYKGDVTGPVKVSTEALGPGDCGYDFETGHRYLIYAGMAAGQLATDICTPTKPIEAASGAELRVLRGEPAAPEDLLDIQTYYKRYAPDWTGELCGRVTKSDGKPFQYASLWVTQVRDDPSLPSAGVRDSRGPDKNGNFCVRGIRPGRYLLNGRYIDWKKHVRWSGCFPVGGPASSASAIEISAGSRVSDVTLVVQQQPLNRSGDRVGKDPCSNPLPANLK